MGLIFDIIGVLTYGIIRKNFTECDPYRFIFVTIVGLINYSTSPIISLATMWLFIVLVDRNFETNYQILNQDLGLRN